MDGWDLALVMASGLDLATTIYALDAGAVEGNPFAPQAIEAMVAVKLAGTAGLIAVRAYLDAHCGIWGHRIGLGLVILGMVAFAIAGVANLRF